MDVTFVTLAEEPQLRTGMWAVALVHGRSSCSMVGLAPDGKVIARINSVPFTWTGSCDDDLPDQGWDAVLEGAFSRAHADGMPAISLLETRGLADVPGALAPVHVSVEQNHAVYVEPNLWMHHRVATDA